MQQNRQELLEVVGESGNVLRLERRDVIHRDGLLNRDVLVWFWNDKGEILFERRALTKDTNPGILASTVGGHPNPGETALACALREIQEETGLIVSPNELVHVGTGVVCHVDTNGTISNHYRESFAYHWNGEADNLEANPEETSGWEWWSYEQMIGMSKDEAITNFGPHIFQPNTQEVLASVHALFVARVSR